MRFNAKFVKGFVEIDKTLIHNLFMCNFKCKQRIYKIKYSQWWALAL